MSWSRLIRSGLAVELLCCAIVPFAETDANHRTEPLETKPRTAQISHADKAMLTTMALSALGVDATLRGDWQSLVTDDLGDDFGGDGGLLTSLGLTHEELNERMVRYATVAAGEEEEGKREGEGEGEGDGRILRFASDPLGEDVEDICGIWSHACDDAGTQVKFAFDGENALTQQVRCG